MIKTDVGSNEKLPMMCARCAAIVEANYPEALSEGLEK
jgi:isoleucyl-tRNA synthetase